MEDTFEVFTDYMQCCDTNNSSPEIGTTVYIFQDLAFLQATQTPFKDSAVIGKEASKLLYITCAPKNFYLNHRIKQISDDLLNNEWGTMTYKFLSNKTTNSLRHFVYSIYSSWA